MTTAPIHNAAYYIQHLQLEKHPEGGYFKESYRSQGSIPALALPAAFGGSRSFSTAIYYMLEAGDFSAFHRIRSDECWHFYAGDTLLIHIIEKDGSYYCQRLGSRIAEGEVFQYVVPAEAWFAAQPAHASAFSLVGCTVSPGFDFLDFELAEQQQLAAQYPAHRDLIASLCR